MSCPHTTRRHVLYAGSMLAGGSVLAGGLVGGPLLAATPPATHVGPKPFVAGKGLQRQVHYALPVGAVRPTGWLQSQLTLQARGMCGNMDIISDYPEVGAGTQWTGVRPGADVRAERTPYWLDGLVPLAYMVDDPVLAARMQQKVRRWLAWPLAKDGNIRAALDNDHDGKHEKFAKSWWPAMPLLKAMTQYYELTNDPVVLDRMYYYFNQQLDEIDHNPFKWWASYRWQDNVLAIFWLYTRLDAKTDAARRQRLLALADKLRIPGQGFSAESGEAGTGSFDWVSKLNDVADMRIPGSQESRPLWKHGVNVGQALKTGAVLSLYPDLSGADVTAKRALIHQWLDMLDTYHGLPTGIFSACEHLAGRDPSNGTETCTVADTLYSLEYALTVEGSGALGDRIERIAYNCMPAALDTHMRTRQYNTQCNQVTAMGGGPWSTDRGPWANVFSLAGLLGCCTANHAQGWPKFVSSMWMALPAKAGAPDGLVVAVYGPSKASTVLNGHAVELEQVTDYPFKHAVTIRVNSVAGGSMAFPLKLRVPSWARKTMTVQVNGAAQPVTDDWVQISRNWKAGDRVTIDFHTTPQVQVSDHDGSVTFHDGPLVFARAIPAQTQVRNTDPHTAGGHAWDLSKNPDEAGFKPDYDRTLDYTLVNDDVTRHTLQASSWAYAASANPGQTITRREAGSVAPLPFSPSQPAVTLQIDAFPVQAGAWPMVKSTEPKLVKSEWPDAWYAAPPPTALTRAQIGALQSMTLVPYAATMLRLTAFAKAPV